MIRQIVAIAAALTIGTAQAGAETPSLRVAVLKFGTVNWELDTIAHEGFDAEQGFELDVRGMAGSAAAQVAFQGGEADVIVSDWLWVARQRAAGNDYVFLPYSKAVGGVMVPQDSDARSLADLAGGRIGVAGGPLDKSWLILAAHAERAHGVDLKAETEQVFGAPPLIYKTAVDGGLEGAINYWHFGAKMKAAGMRELITVGAAAEALGLDPDTPLLGYVFRGEMLEQRPDLVAGFAEASRATKALLAEDDAAWDRLRPLMNATDEAEFEALKAGWREGIPEPGPVDEAAADRMLRLMAELGGEALTGSATELPDGTFVQPGS